MKQNFTVFIVDTSRSMKENNKLDRLQNVFNRLKQTNTLNQNYVLATISSDDTVTTSEDLVIKKENHSSDIGCPDDISTIHAELQSKYPLNQYNVNIFLFTDYKKIHFGNSPFINNIFYLANDNDDLLDGDDFYHLFSPDQIDFELFDTLVKILKIKPQRKNIYYPITVAVAVAASIVLTIIFVYRFTFGNNSSKENNAIYIQNTSGDQSPITNGDNSPVTINNVEPNIDIRIEQNIHTSNQIEINDWNQKPQKDTIVLIIPDPIVKKLPGGDIAINTEITMGYKIENYPSGEYRVTKSPATWEVLKSCRKSIYTQIKQFEEIESFVIVFEGEADAVSIKKAKRYKGKDIDDVMYSLNREPAFISIKNNDKIKDNNSLAFLRFYSIEESFYDDAIIEETPVQYRRSVITNDDTQKIGGQYRNVKIKIDIKGKPKSNQTLVTQR